MIFRRIQFAALAIRQQLDDVAQLKWRTRIEVMLRAIIIRAQIRATHLPRRNRLICAASYRMGSW